MIRKITFILRITIFFISIIFNTTANARSPSDPLPSWNEGRAKKAILEFVRITTDKQNSRYVPPQQRIATFAKGTSITAIDVALEPDATSILCLFTNSVTTGLCQETA
jgi:hypothetical protein